MNGPKAVFSFSAVFGEVRVDPDLGLVRLVAANADIPELDVLFVGDFDEEASLLGTKGLGELTAVSVTPAIANAVYRATGKRMRDLPTTVEKLL